MADHKTPRCQAVVYKKDTYRRTGRGRNGFEMHYNEEQCSRVATVEDRCLQHSKSLYGRSSSYKYAVPYLDLTSRSK